VKREWLGCQGAGGRAASAPSGALSFRPCASPSPFSSPHTRTWSAPGAVTSVADAVAPPDRVAGRRRRAVAGAIGNKRPKKKKNGGGLALPFLFLDRHRERGHRGSLRRGGGGGACLDGTSARRRCVYAGSFAPCKVREKRGAPTSAGSPIHSVQPHHLAPPCPTPPASSPPWPPSTSSSRRPATLGQPNSRTQRRRCCRCSTSWVRGGRVFSFFSFFFLFFFPARLAGALPFCFSRACAGLFLLVQRFPCSRADISIGGILEACRPASPPPCPRV